MDRRLRAKWTLLKYYELCLKNNVGDNHELKINIANIKSLDGTLR